MQNLEIIDIRDIREEVVYPRINALGSIFTLQKQLLVHYKKIEGLPEWPVDLNSRQSQKLMKDFIGRVIEELGEGFESYFIMMQMFKQGVDEEEMIPHLQNFNEEVSDALHFWLEVMVYSGYEENDMRRWLSDHMDLSTQEPVDVLRGWFSMAELAVQQEMQLKRLPTKWVIKDHMLNDEFLRGGRQLSTDRMNIIKQYLWDITFTLQIARNTLKNKPWKQTEMMTDTSQYEDSVKDSCLALFKFLYFAGFTPESVYTIYYKKNHVNQFRIRSRY